MQTGEINSIMGQMAIEPSDSVLAIGPRDNTPSTPLELLILSWDQFVNELEFE